MRVLLFPNNWGGWQISRWLREQGDEIVGLVIQPESDQRYAPEILAALKMPADRVWRAPDLRRPETVSKLRELQPELGISAWFGYVLKPDVIQLFSRGVINLHTAYLPWNRGWHTNVWPIIEGTPAGMTLHYIDEKVDTGDIIAQRRVPVEPTDTGGSLHQKITSGLVQLFKETWPLIKAGKNARTIQDHSHATIHRKADLAAIDLIDLQKQYPARQLLNLLRARTYPPYPAAYFMEDSRRIYVRVQLFEEGELAPLGMGERVVRSLPCIDLDRPYLARELLDMMGEKVQGPGPSAYFVYDSRRIYVQVRRLGEKDLNPSGTPEWMSKMP